MTPTPHQRIEAVTTDDMTDAQARSMLNYLIGALAGLVLSGGLTDVRLAAMIERAKHFGGLAK